MRLRLAHRALRPVLYIYGYPSFSAYIIILHNQIFPNPKRYYLAAFTVNGGSGKLGTMTVEKIWSDRYNRIVITTRELSKRSERKAVASSEDMYISGYT